MTLLTSKGAGMAYPHETDERGVVTKKNPNANQPAAAPVEATAVTSRATDPVPANTTFADRKAVTSAQAENKSVTMSMNKDELLTEAARRGITADDSMTKEQIIEAINAG